MSADRHVSFIRVSPFGWCAIALVLVFPWVIVLWLLAPARPSSPAATAAAKRAAASAQPTSPTANGPWGRLTSSRILIEPPEDFIPPFFTTPQPTRWTFRGYSVESLSALWEATGLTSAQRQTLDNPTYRQTSGDVIVVQPPAELVLGLAPDTRAKLYAVLARSPENVPQRDPFRSRAEAVDDWFADHALPPEIVALTRQLLYPRAGNLLFSDHDLVLPQLASESARSRYIKILSRKSALLVQLHIEHGQDVAPLARYWGHGRRSKDIGPLLESLAQRPAGGAIDLVHLLPPFPRSLLYTFPAASSPVSDGMHDCHWTSLNFFNTQPDERFNDLGFVHRALINDYLRVGGDPEMGDIILLVQDGSEGVHSCVYLADDIVFTKNGAAFSVPWTLAKLENVISFYSLAGPLEVRRYRAK